MSEEKVYSFEWARDNDATVNSMLRQNRPLTEIIAVLVYQKTLVTDKLMELAAVAPRKTVLPDGKTLIWRCPEHLI